MNKTIGTKDEAVYICIDEKYNEHVVYVSLNGYQVSGLNINKNIAEKLIPLLHEYLSKIDA